MELIKSIGKKVLTFLIYALGAIILLNIIGFAVNNLFFVHELDSITPYGQLVEVNQHKMHVYSMGNGDKTIVLLPGFGVALPCADFGPLMREFSKEYTIVCLEYFGVGFSDQTNTPRTNENFTEEIRTVLSLAGFKAPYILMPHSASGIYCEYFAAKYPEEVSSIIMLDTTSTVKTEAKNIPKFLYSISKLQQACGLTRLATVFVKFPQKEENGYTKKEIRDYKIFINYVLNDTIIDQSYRMLDNINEVSEIVFPISIPVLKLISTQSWNKVGEEYQSNHLKRLGPKAEKKLIDGSHFIYQTNVKEIVDSTNTFLQKNFSQDSHRK